MCDAFETGRCPIRILVTSNAVCLRQLVHYLQENFIMFETVSFSETDKGILLFTTQDRDECVTMLKTICSQAASFGNCFHEYVLNDSLNSYQHVSNVCECDSTS